MNKKYEFDIKSFNKINIWKFVLIWLIISLFFNMLVIKEKWSIIDLLIILACCGITPLCIYLYKIGIWSFAYIEFDNGQINYFRVIKSGYTNPEDVSGYVYEASLANIMSISKTEVTKNKIIVNGNIEITKFMDETHEKYKIKNVNRIEIPLYFDKNDALIERINSFMIK